MPSSFLSVRCIEAEECTDGFHFQLEPIANANLL